jgi:hypothetical protein
MIDGAQGKWIAVAESESRLLSDFTWAGDDRFIYDRINWEGYQSRYRLGGSH